MPALIDYSAVVAEADRLGLVSLYPNSGAFGFPREVATHSVGWVIADDPTLRPAARELTVAVAPPTTHRLAELAVVAWRSHFAAAPAWVLPKAHWAYELDFGSGEWMPDLLRAAGADPDGLSPRHDGSAIAFPASEADALVPLLDGLLGRLLGSDFAMLFPGHAVTCTVHHHKQIWWTSTDATLIADLRALA